MSDGNIHACSPTCIIPSTPTRVSASAATAGPTEASALLPQFIIFPLDQPVSLFEMEWWTPGSSRAPTLLPTEERVVENPTPDT